MRITNILVAAVVAFAPSAAMADLLTYNSAPTFPYNYGSGNNYTPSNSAVLTTTTGDELDLRAHLTFATAPASDLGGVYSFATAPGASLSFDWGLKSGTGTFTGTTALITLTNLATNQFFTFDPLLTPDNVVSNGWTSNSFRASWFPVGFNPTVNDTYKVDLAFNGKSVDVFAKFGDGASAAPEPASWAMMVGGFGLIGGAMRRRQRTAVSFA